jgi:hypothetical protein
MSLCSDAPGGWHDTDDALLKWLAPVRAAAAMRKAEGGGQGEAGGGEGVGEGGANGPGGGAGAADGQSTALFAASPAAPPPPAPAASARCAAPHPPLDWAAVARPPSSDDEDDTEGGTAGDTGGEAWEAGLVLGRNGSTWLLPSAERALHEIPWGGEEDGPRVSVGRGAAGAWPGAAEAGRLEGEDELWGLNTEERAQLCALWMGKKHAPAYMEMARVAEEYDRIAKDKVGKHLHSRAFALPRTDTRAHAPPPYACTRMAEEYDWIAKDKVRRDALTHTHTGAHAATLFCTPPPTNTCLRGSAV